MEWGRRRGWPLESAVGKVSYLTGSCRKSMQPRCSPESGCSEYLDEASLHSDSVAWSLLVGLLSS